MQITKSFISITNNDGYPIEVVDSYYDIEKYLDKAELIVVATAGTVILEPDHIWNSIHNIRYLDHLGGPVRRFRQRRSNHD